MYLSDYHMHCYFSMDSSERLANICKRAVDMGLQEIAITDHADLYEGVRFDYINFKEREKALAKIREKYQGRLIIRNGLELGQPQANPQDSARILQHRFDFIIGSIHEVGLDLWEEPVSGETDAVERIFSAYIDDLITLARDYDFDVLGHITFLLRYMDEPSRQAIRLTDYEEKYRHLFKLLAERGKGLEVNTSGLNNPMQETLPSSLLLSWYRECGGEIITTGSDAHRAKNVGFAIKETCEMLKSVGFSHVMTYADRKMKAYKL